MRRVIVLLLALLGLLAAGVALPVSSVAPEPALAVADSGAAYDAAVGGADCALLGRAYTPQLGCARNRCVAGAVPWRKVPGAEVCALPGQPAGYGFGATVDVRTCRSLGRRWITVANYCASEPDRSLVAVRDAAACTPPTTVYVILAEKPGRYDECVTSAQVDTLSPAALAPVLAARQRRTPAAPGGVLLVGDSVGWRGSDELAGLAPAWTVDAEPGRRPAELAARLRSLRTQHGPPDGLVVELGTNRSPGFRRRDLAASLRVSPRTPVVLVLPYVADSPWSRRVDGWMRSIASTRPLTCVADWPAYVSAHPGLLQDGIHTWHADEGVWARWLLREWERC